MLIIGLASSENDYKIAWLLNNYFEINLTQHEEFSVNDDWDSTMFSVFSCKQTDHFFILIKNRSSNSLLSVKNKNLDFILYFIFPKKAKNLTEILSLIKKIPEVRTAFEIKNDKVLEKIPGRLIF